MLPLPSTRRPSRHTLGLLFSTRLFNLRRTLVFCLLVTGALFVLHRPVSHSQAPPPCIDPFSLSNGSFDPIYPHPSHTSYRPFQFYSTVFPYSLSQSANDLPSNCVDAFVDQGLPCHSSHYPPKLDVVYTWVNGSDPLINSTIFALATEYTHKHMDGAMSQLYREHDELRHSIRSVFHHFNPHLASVHVVTSDVSAPLCEPQPSHQWRLGHIPQWLDIEGTHSIPINIWHHAQIFDEYKTSSFNSYAIETQLKNIPKLSENFLYMNDDFFFLSNLQVSDFYTDAFGPVLRMQSDLLVKPHRDNIGASPEWQALEYTNGLISDRFGARYRPYSAHQARALSVSIMRELTSIWAEQINATASRPFRGTSHGLGDLYMSFLATHFIVERWREALLWTFVVAKIGSADGVWGEAEAQSAWQAIGGATGSIETKVLRGERETLEFGRVRRILEKGGHGDQTLNSRRTTYVFSSADGYPYTGFGRRGSYSWTPDPDKFDPGERCTMEFDDCFATVRDGRKLTSDDVFKRVAFERPYACGDCIITALVTASGRLGLSAFLPSPNRTFQAKPGDSQDRREKPIPIPILPLTPTWWKTDFSLDSVLSPYASNATPSTPIDLRAWVVQVLQRYRFVIGETPAMFALLSNPQQAQQLLGRIGSSDSIRPREALLCINDDIQKDHDTVAKLLMEFMRNQWPTPSPWEKDVQDRPTRL
ncbi:hypothetical protein BS47DRAFT_1325910 [Hydnum rufescens UP504]|uniref:Stealth protein CR3 conserved region 3 domain-containing protein n=1 Tax=Hydnum rufescens UP504 TaxID=1448309 RepID=A0A9P6B7N1_9AGAM|nr:hypothetical protein BS47DRAFT_1325910 [Hydnum rufescens UP504]